MPLANQIAAYRSWANTPDRTARTANGRKALEQKFLDENDGDPQRAAAARKAHFLELAQKSAQSRKHRREAKEAARQAHIAALLAGGDVS
jgi:hypothetical protein